MVLRVSSVSFVIIFCFFVNFVHSYESYGNLMKGDACHHDEKNLPGICKMIIECKEAREGLLAQKLPQTCGFEGNIPIVCCASTESPSTTISTAPKHQLQNRFPGDISNKKCVEYGQIVYKQVELPILGSGSAKSVFINESDCSVKPTFVHGGENAGPKEFPHMALLGYGDKNRIQWACGGSLISEQFVLTAAHCMSEQGLGLVRWVHLGDLDISITTDDALVQEFEVKTRIRHPSYKRPSSYHDIALLELDRPVQFTDYVRPACLQTSNTKEERFLVTGWGHLSFDVKKLSNILQKAVVEEFDIDECSERYAQHSGGIKLRSGVVDDSQLCAGGKKDDHDTCPGDSGGPLQINHPEVFCMYSIVGVTAIGQQRCGVTGIPTIYTRVSNYIQWIEDNVWPQY